MGHPSEDLWRAICLICLALLLGFLFGVILNWIMDQLSIV